MRIPGFLGPRGLSLELPWGAPIWGPSFLPMSRLAGRAQVLGGTC